MSMKFESLLNKLDKHGAEYGSVNGQILEFTLLGVTYKAHLNNDRLKVEYYTRDFTPEELGFALYGSEYNSFSQVLESAEQEPKLREGYKKYIKESKQQTQYIPSYVAWLYSFASLECIRD